MSRIGKLPIALPAGVSVKVDNNVITVKGPKGELSQKFHSDLTVKVEDNHIVVTRPSDDIEHRAQHGLVRALIHNMVVGVSEGFKKEMELVGVGYRATTNGPVLELQLGFSHATYILLLSSSHAINNFSARCAPKSAPSASPNPTKVKVSSLSVKLFVASRVNQQVLNNKFQLS